MFMFSSCQNPMNRLVVNSYIQNVLMWLPHDPNIILTWQPIHCLHEIPGHSLSLYAQNVLMWVSNDPNIILIWQPFHSLHKIPGHSLSLYIQNVLMRVSHDPNNYHPHLAINSLPTPYFQDSNATHCLCLRPHRVFSTLLWRLSHHGTFRGGLPHGTFRGFPIIGFPIMVGPSGGYHHASGGFPLWDLRGVSHHGTFRGFPIMGPRGGVPTMGPSGGSHHGTFWNSAGTILYQTSAIAYILQAHTHTMVCCHYTQLTPDKWNWNCTCARYALKNYDMLLILVKTINILYR